MTAELLTVEAHLKDYISQNLKVIENNMNVLANRTDTSFKKMTSVTMMWGKAIAAVYAVNRIVHFANQFVASAEKQMQAEAKLTQALGYRNSALLEQSTALQKVTTYGDEQVIGVQATLAAYIKEEGQLKRLTPVILDFAAAKGMDAVSAADLFVKSIASGTNALGRYGISLEGGKTRTERLEMAITKTSAAYGGMARALAQTDFGKLETAKNLLDDHKEKLGNLILPLYVQWFGWVVKIADKLLPMLGIHESGIAKQQAKLSTMRMELDGLRKLVDTPILSKLYDKRYLDTLEKYNVEQAKLNEMIASQNAAELAGKANPVPPPPPEPTKDKPKTVDPDAEAKAWEKVIEDAQANLDAVKKIQEDRASVAEQLEQMRLQMMDDEVANTNRHLKEMDRMRQDDLRKEQAALEAKVGYANRLAESTITLANIAVEAAGASAREQQQIASGLALVQAGLAAVLAIAAVWEDTSMELWEKIAMTVVVGAEVIASAAVYIDQINKASFAKGTRSAPGGNALVGEAGPELVMGPTVGYLPAGSRVYNAGETQAMMGSNINITVNGGATNADAERVVEALMQAEREGRLRNRSLSFARA